LRDALSRVSLNISPMLSCSRSRLRRPFDAVAVVRGIEQIVDGTAKGIREAASAAAFA
jgi:hypothetical protein